MPFQTISENSNSMLGLEMENNASLQGKELSTNDESSAKNIELPVNDNDSSKNFKLLKSDESPSMSNGGNHMSESVEHVENQAPSTPATDQMGVHNIDPSGAVGKDDSKLAFYFNIYNFK